MSAKGHDIKSWRACWTYKEQGSMSTLDVFDIFSRDYVRERFETMSLRDWLLAARNSLERRLVGDVRILLDQLQKSLGNRAVETKAMNVPFDGHLAQRHCARLS